MGAQSTMESLEVMPFGGRYNGCRVLLTGHTGFKGGWLALWLKELGAEVTGLALAPETGPSHWELLQLDISEKRIDLRDAGAVSEVMRAARPEIVFHLAAQALVRRSYRDPLETWSTNVMGTTNLLDACRHVPGIRAVVVVTSDKCYENQEWPWGYREIDRLGGHDPYSASKAAAELVVSSYRKAFFHLPGAPLLATARAGNVIGGGDWSEDRLIPDLVRAIANKTSLEIRSPGATRPWQHVLESLSGYLCLGRKLLDGEEQMASSWNFGPEPEGNRSVSEVLTRLTAHWPELAWHVTSRPQPHEANLLYLDSSKAKGRLGWRPVWGLTDTLAMTAGWYRNFSNTGEISSRDQLASYISAAKKAGMEWSGT